MLNPTLHSYHEVVSIRKDGPLDVHALRSAFNEVVRRHDVWRSTFEFVDGQPSQVCRDASEYAIPLIDLSGLSPEAAERRAVALIAEVVALPYPLASGPLLRPRLIRFPGEHHRLYLALHHLIFDGGSMKSVILRELIELYEASCSGISPSLSEPARYADFAAWEHEWIDSPRARRRVEYWRDRLRDAPSLMLPQDRPRSSALRTSGAELAVSVSNGTVERLRMIATEHRASLFHVLAAAWTVLLTRYSGQEDVVFATVADLRQRPEHRTVVGFCVSPLVLRVDAGGEPSFTTLLSRVRDELLDGLDNLVPFERVVRELRPDPIDAGRSAFYQTMIGLEPKTAQPPGGWTLNQMENDIGSRVGNLKVDIELQLDERPSGELAGRLIFDTDLFLRKSAKRLLGHWQTLLESICAHPDALIADLRMLTAPELDQLQEWNATTVEWPPDVGEATQLQLAFADELGLVPLDAVLALPDSTESAWELATALAEISGARLVEASPADAESGAQLSRLIRTERITFLPAAPAVWERLLATGLRPARGLRALSVGAPLSQAVAAGLCERFSVVWHAYGSRALGGARLLGRVEDPARRTLGRPLANTRAHVLDRMGQPVPIGVPGELWLAGPGIGPGLSSIVDDDAFRPEPGLPGVAMRTGDRVRRRADGSLELLPT